LGTCLGWLSSTRGGGLEEREHPAAISTRQQPPSPPPVVAHTNLAESQSRPHTTCLLRPSIRRALVRNGSFSPAGCSPASTPSPGPRCQRGISWSNRLSVDFDCRRRHRQHTRATAAASPLFPSLSCAPSDLSPMPSSQPQPSAIAPCRRPWPRPPSPRHAPISVACPRPPRTPAGSRCPPLRGDAGPAASRLHTRRRRQVTSCRLVASAMPHLQRRKRTEIA
jgi:hypothetical protein